MTRTVVTVARGLRWYVKQLTGEAKWDEYLDRCRRENSKPMTRSEFERHRSDHQERSTQSRCC
jgi:uncharacterized short protein YbdD (DUF466 family)